MPASSGLPRTLLILAKPPLMGLAKTRLARDLGSPAQASRIARFLTRRTLAQVSDPRWHTRLLVAPARHLHHLELCPDRLRDRQVQAHGDLGDRLQAAFLGAPHGSVLVIGTDTPGMTRQHLAAAFAALRSHDVVVGPATDGGFWLFGVRPGHPRAGLFTDVPWSAPDTLERLLARLPPHARIARLDTLPDIDTAHDVQTVLQRPRIWTLHRR